MLTALIYFAIVYLSGVFLVVMLNAITSKRITFDKTVWFSWFALIGLIAYLIIDSLMGKWSK
jgi:uncharacterized membrane protein YuzA (DUF378 family)